jgi:hypothetical protein
MQNLKGILPDKAIQVITALQSELGTLGTNFKGLLSKGVLTPSQAETSFGPTAQRSALQASGKTPMNVSGLPGLLGQAQFALANNQSGAPSAGPGSQPGTIVTINNVINEVMSPGQAQALSALAYFLFDTRANRIANYPAANYPPGTPFVETDSTLIYWVQVVSGSNAWVYLSGTYQRTQAQLAALEATLGTNDSGLLCDVTDYAHVLVWGGSAFGWGPGESGSGYLQPFAVAPTGSGWQACDGSAGVNYMKADGTLGAVNVPNTNSTAAYINASGSYSASITAAVKPTVTPTGTVAATFTGTPSGSTNVLNTGGATAVVPTPFTPAGNVAATFTGALDTANLPGDPVANFPALLFFRQ